MTAAKHDRSEEPEEAVQADESEAEQPAADGAGEEAAEDQAAEDQGGESVEDVLRAQVAELQEPLLTEMDNFERAIGAASPDAFQDFATGVSMIKQNVDDILASQGIEAIPAEGVFDPALHEVVSEVEDAERKRGEIVEVFRTGYRLGGQVIRAAQVVVARPPKIEQSAGQSDGDDAGE